MKKPVSRSRCVFVLAEDTGGSWQLLVLPGRSRDVDGVPAVVIRHDLLTGAPGVPDEHPGCPGTGRRRRLIMGWCLVC